MAYELLATGIDIGAGEMTGTALAVVELEGAVELQVVVGVTETAVAVAVPEEAVVLVGHHEGDADLGVILEEVLVLALHVELLALVLTQTVERLVSGGVELHLP